MYYNINILISLKKKNWTVVYISYIISKKLQNLFESGAKYVLKLSSFYIIFRKMQ